MSGSRRNSNPVSMFLASLRSCTRGSAAASTSSNAAGHGPSATTSATAVPAEIPRIVVYKDEADGTETGGGSNVDRPSSHISSSHSKSRSPKPHLAARSPNSARSVNTASPQPAAGRQISLLTKPRASTTVILPNSIEKHTTHHPHSTSQQHQSSSSSPLSASKVRLHLQSSWPANEKVPQIFINDIPLINTRVIGHGGYSTIVSGTFADKCGGTSTATRTERFAVKIFHSARHSRREFDSLLRSELVALRLPPSEHVIRSLYVSAFHRANSTASSASDDDAKNIYGLVVMQSVCVCSLQQLLTGALETSAADEIYARTTTTKSSTDTRELMSLSLLCSPQPTAKVPAIVDGEESQLRISLQICLQIAVAAEFLHANNIAHLDIKPSNVMVNFAPDTSAAGDSAKLLRLFGGSNETGLRCQLGDFGSAIDLTAHLSAPTVNKIALRCTIPYEAPELYAGQVPTTKCDTFSLGMLFWQVITRTAHIHAHDDSGEPLMSHQLIYHIVKYKWRPSLDALPNCSPPVSSSYTAAMMKTNRNPMAKEQNTSHGDEHEDVYSNIWLRELLSTMWHHDPVQRCDSAQIISVVSNNICL